MPRGSGLHALGRAFELAPIADDDYAVTEAGVEKRIAEFRTDAGRLTGGYDEWLALRHT